MEDLQVGDSVVAGEDRGTIIFVKDDLAWIEWDDGDNSLEDLDNLEGRA